MENKKVTVLVNSCDLYEDAWYPFFKLFNTYWTDCPYRVILNTETKQFSMDEMKIEVFNTACGLTWSKRFLLALKEIDTEYVLFFLEDFFIMSDVRRDVFDKAIECMDNDKNIGAVCLNPDVDFDHWHTDGIYSEYFTEILRSSHARVNAVAALWRKSFLEKIIREKESPWDFELLGTKRAKLCKEKILCLAPGTPPPFDFHFLKHFGYGISQKKWLPENKVLFEKHGITVDFEKLGWFDMNQGKRVHRTTKEKLQLIYKNPKELFGMVMEKLKRL